MLEEQNVVDLRHRHWEMALSPRSAQEVVAVFNELERVEAKESGMTKFMREVSERKNG